MFCATPRFLKHITRDCKFMLAAAWLFYFSISRVAVEDNVNEHEIEWKCNGWTRERENPKILVNLFQTSSFLFGLPRVSFQIKRGKRRNRRVLRWARGLMIACWPPMKTISSHLCSVTWRAFDSLKAILLMFLVKYLSDFYTPTSKIFRNSQQIRCPKAISLHSQPRICVYIHEISFLNK